MRLNSYFSMDTWDYDAVVFKPKRNIKFLGFGVFSDYNSNDVTYTVQWSLDDNKSDEFQIHKLDSERDPEKNWHSITLKELG